VITSQPNTKEKLITQDKNMENITIDELTELIRQIDDMSQIELCQLWRHAPSGNKYISGLAGKYFTDRLYKHFDGFTPTISKTIGW